MLYGYIFVESDRWVYASWIGLIEHTLMSRHRQSSLLALILCMLVIMMASSKSLHEQLPGHDSDEMCEYCLKSTDNTWLPPLLVILPAIWLDHAPETILPAILPAALWGSMLPKVPPPVSASR